MSGSVIKKGAKVKYSIIAENVTVEEGAVIGSDPVEIENRDDWGVAVIGSGLNVGKDATVSPKAMIKEDVKEGDQI